eukprot:195510_1
MASLSIILTIAYITIQVSIAISLSIIGAIHVKRCINNEKLNPSESSNENQINTELEIKEDTGHERVILLPESNGDETKEDYKAKDKTKIYENTDKSQVSHFCILWGKTVWKMRGVYSGLAVHSFDVLTDVLVIIEWLKTPNIEGDNIDPQTMAYSALAVLLFSKFVSTVAIYVKEQNIFRCILQFFDLLIFAEIFESHRKIISQLKTANLKAKDKNAIESTLSFKYIRNLEAVFESIPEAVLQLVYVMRTSKIGYIFMFSIAQSIISMTNSILNNDHTQMQSDRFKSYKQRLPPTFNCFKHSIARLSEVIYRLGLLSLFWSVCGGLALGILLAVELLCISFRTWMLIQQNRAQFDVDTILLSINSIIVVPAEEVFAHSDFSELLFNDDTFMCMLLSIFNCFCCVFCCGLVTSIGGLYSVGDISYIPVTKIGMSFGELIFMVLWGNFAENGDRKKFMFDYEYGLYVFIGTIFCYLIYTQYVALFPHFSLPYNVSVRSKWGYAMANELTELQKMNVPSKIIEKNRRQFWDEIYENIEVEYEQTYPPMKIPVTAASIAQAKGHFNVVHWLEEQGAKMHKKEMGWIPEIAMKQDAEFHMKKLNMSGEDLKNVYGFAFSDLEKIKQYAKQEQLKHIDQIHEIEIKNTKIHVTAAIIAHACAQAIAEDNFNDKANFDIFNWLE